MDADDWLSAIRFTDLNVTYRAVETGYLGNFPARKFRAVFKAILQSQSPCLDQRQMACAACAHRASCLYHALLVEDARRDYLPYLIHTAPSQRARGMFRQGDTLSFTLRLLGYGTEKTQEVRDAFVSKPLIAFDSVDEQSPLAMTLEGVETANGGRPFRLEDLLVEYVRSGKIRATPVTRVAIDFLTPFHFTFQNRKVTQPEDMTVELFMEALHRRLAGVSTQHCGFTGTVPALETILDGNSVSLERHGDFRFVHRVATKKHPSGKKTQEPIKGFMGGVELKGEVALLLPLLVLGEALHIGQHTTQGMGQYHISRIKLGQEYA